MKRLGLALDWSREFATCDIDYYQHQQALFLAFFKKGLVYRKKSRVNWDPVDQTVLANEQVLDGKGWRSGAQIEVRELHQWFFKITDYADDLLEGLEGLKDWPDKVRLMQKNWIGRSRGLSFVFDFDPATPPPPDSENIEVYTTRPDTLFGAGFCALAPDHPLTCRLAEKDKNLRDFIRDCQKTGMTQEALEKAEKKGVDTGLRVLHPFDSGKTLPVWVANFVLSSYGTGAIFGCPAHDQRDLDFARRYGLDITPVILPPGTDPHDFTIEDTAYTGPGTLFNADFFEWS